MPLILFLLILSALVIVHELGHFGVAKSFGIRVDEFGLGYPPKAKRLFAWKGTDFTLNWLPFGGFVKIFGESYSEEGDYSEASQDSESFQNKNRGIQAAVLVAGVAGNFLFAWLLFSIGFMTGLPAPAGMDLPVSDARTVITMVIPGSPADTAGLKTGDAIVSLTRGSETAPAAQAAISPEEASAFISSSAEPLHFGISRGGSAMDRLVYPSSGLVEGRPAVGISMESIGTVKLPFFRSISQGLKTAVELTYETAKALGTFIKEAVTGKADLSSVTGPVGLVGMVGDVSQLGFGHLLTFIALISINLSIINLLPFPALDGGRLLFVAIEAATRKRIPSRVFNSLNAAGFALLILLMILITIQDVRNIL
jgi:regulator of sigma E protease